MLREVRPETALKHVHKSDDSVNVSSCCVACALPVMDGFESCPFCGAETLGSGPWLLRLSRHEDSFELHKVETLVARAERQGELWSVDTGGPDEHMLLTSRDATGTEAVLMDGELHRLASIRTARGGRGRATVLRDAADNIVAIVRGDGTGGLHAMSVDGTVLLFAGRSAAPVPTLDLLVTDAGADRPLVILLALALTLEIEHLGPLYEAPGHTSPA